MAAFAYDVWDDDESSSTSTEESSDSDGHASVAGRLDLSHGEVASWTDVSLVASASSAPILVLKLHHNELKSISGVADFHHLVSIDVSDNRLSSLPDEIVRLRHLRELEAKNNRIDDGGLPKDFGLLQELRLVNLAGNSLESLPPQLCELRLLRALYLGGNLIRRIPVDVERMEMLETLYLGGNRLEHVPATLGKMPRLRSLSLCNNKLVTIPSTLVHLRRLKSLSLHGNRLTTLPQEIVNLDLRELSLRDNPLVNRFVGDLTFRAPTLRELAARVVKIHRLPYCASTLPRGLVDYLDAAQRCVNPRCAGVYFDVRVEHINFVDFCGKYRLPLLQYLCSPKCSNPESPAVVDPTKIAKVLLG